jgi:hypothetical protein
MMSTYSISLFLYISLLLVYLKDLLSFQQGFIVVTVHMLYAYQIYS